jgi:hypothetical protein
MKEKQEKITEDPGAADKLKQEDTTFQSLTIFFFFNIFWGVY